MVVFKCLWGQRQTVQWRWRKPHLDWSDILSSRSSTTFSVVIVTLCHSIVIYNDKFDRARMGLNTKRLQGNRFRLDQKYKHKHVFSKGPKQCCKNYPRVLHFKCEYIKLRYHLIHLKDNTSIQVLNYLIINVLECQKTFSGSKWVRFFFFFYPIAEKIDSIWRCASTQKMGQLKYSPSTSKFNLSKWT